MLSYMASLDGLQAMLDGIGLFLEPADGLNALIYLFRGDVASAGLSALSVLPYVGDIIGKGGKLAKSAGSDLFIKAARGGRALLSGGPSLVLKTTEGWKKVAMKLDLSYKVAAGKAGQLLRQLEDMVGHLGEGLASGFRRLAGEEGVYELALPDGGRIRVTIDQMDDVGGGGAGYGGGSIPKGGTSAKGLIGHDFEDYLSKTIGGEGSFSVRGRDFDGGIGNRWWEAKSGNYWRMLEENPNKLAKFKSDMGDRLRIATENGATYELFSNTPIPKSIKQWLTKKGITFTELLD